MYRSAVVLTVASLAATCLAAVAGTVPAGAVSPPYTVQQITGIAGAVPQGGAVANDAGQVASTSPVTSPSCATPFCFHAIRWTAAGGAQDLGTLGGPTSTAGAINAAGDVAGTSDVTTLSTGHAFLWTSTGMRDLGVLPGRSQSHARGVNDSDQVVGASSGGGTQHAFSWTPTGGMVDIGALPGDDTSEAQAVNSLGQVIGVSFSSTPAPGGPAHFFIWSTAAGMQALTFPAGLRGSVFSINRWGQIVGQASSNGGPPHPVLFDAGTWTDLGLLPGDNQGFATSIDDGGEVVGVSTDQLFPGGNPHLFRWTAAGGMADVTSLLPAIHLTAASNVTNGGSIAATAGSSLGVAPFFLLTPTSAPPSLHLPSSLSVAATGAGGAVVTFEATASGGTAPVAVTCVPASGSTFPVGTTAVRCQAADAVSLTASGSFTVTVAESTPAPGSSPPATPLPQPPMTGATSRAPDRRPLLLALLPLALLAAGVGIRRRRSRT